VSRFFEQAINQRHYDAIDELDGVSGAGRQPRTTVT
jgi:hypothetical protein